MIGGREYSSTQLDIVDSAVKAAVNKCHVRLDKRDVVELESEPHITVTYGLHTSDPTPVEQALKGQGAIKVELGSVSIFETDDADILKIDVEDVTGLQQAHDKLCELPNTQSYSYKPHMTLAYLKKGTGTKYAGMTTGLEGKRLTLNAITFSSKDKRKKTIQCSNGFWFAGKEFAIEVVPPLARAHKEHFRMWLRGLKKVRPQLFERDRIELEFKGSKVILTKVRGGASVRASWSASVDPEEKRFWMEVIRELRRGNRELVQEIRRLPGDRRRLVSPGASIKAGEFTPDVVTFKFPSESIAEQFIDALSRQRLGEDVGEVFNESVDVDVWPDTKDKVMQRAQAFRGRVVKTVKGSQAKAKASFKAGGIPEVYSARFKDETAKKAALKELASTLVAARVNSTGALSISVEDYLNRYEERGGLEKFVQPIVRKYKGETFSWDTRSWVKASSIAAGPRADRPRASFLCAVRPGKQQGSRSSHTLTFSTIRQAASFAARVTRELPGAKLSVDGKRVRVSAGQQGLRHVIRLASRGFNRKQREAMMASVSRGRSWRAAGPFGNRQSPIAKTGLLRFVAPESAFEQFFYALERAGIVIHEDKPERGEITVITRPGENEKLFQIAKRFNAKPRPFGASFAASQGRRIGKPQQHPQTLTFPTAKAAAAFASQCLQSIKGCSVNASGNKVTIKAGSRHAGQVLAMAQGQMSSRGSRGRRTVKAGQSLPELKRVLSQQGVTDEDIVTFIDVERRHGFNSAIKALRVEYGDAVANDVNQALNRSGASKRASNRSSGRTRRSVRASNRSQRVRAWSAADRTGLFIFNFRNDPRGAKRAMDELNALPGDSVQAGPREFGTVLPVMIAAERAINKAVAIAKKHGGRLGDALSHRASNRSSGRTRRSVRASNRSQRGRPWSCARSFTIWLPASVSARFTDEIARDTDAGTFLVESDRGAAGGPQHLIRITYAQSDLAKIKQIASKYSRREASHRASHRSVRAASSPLQAIIQFQTDHDAKLFSKQAELRHASTQARRLGGGTVEVSYSPEARSYLKTEARKLGAIDPLFASNRSGGRARRSVRASNDLEQFRSRLVNELERYGEDRVAEAVDRLSTEKLKFIHSQSVGDIPAAVIVSKKRLRASHRGSKNPVLANAIARKRGATTHSIGADARN